MNEIQCDINHVVEAIKRMEESEDIDRVQVWETDCVMRGISLDEMKERNCLHCSDTVCTIGQKASTTFTLSFHQSQIDGDMEFCFRPPAANEIDANNYHTNVAEMGENLRKVVEKLKEEYSDIAWDLGQINGCSYANRGHITDFEFEFEMIFIN